MEETYAQPDKICEENDEKAPTWKKGSHVDRGTAVSSLWRKWTMQTSKTYILKEEASVVEKRLPKKHREGTRKAPTFYWL